MSWELNISEQKVSCQSKRHFSHFYMANKSREEKFCVYALWLFKQKNRFARTVLWRVRKPIGNVKVNVRTVKHWYFNKVKHDFQFLLTNNCQHSPPRKASAQIKV